MTNPTSEMDLDDESLGIVSVDGVDSDADGSQKGSKGLKEPKEEIGASETKLVNYSKILLLVVILVVAVAIGIIVFFYVRNAEHNDYTRQFENIANEIIQVGDLRVRGIFDSLASFSADITSYTLSANVIWPFVRVPHYQVKGALSNQLTGAETIGFAPLVPYKDRKEWEEFSVANQDWLKEGHEIDKLKHPNLYFDDHISEFDESIQISPYLYKLNRGRPVEVEWPSNDTYADEDAFYNPIWQSAPAPDRTSANLDRRSFTDFDTYLNGMLQNDQPVLTGWGGSNHLKTTYNGRYTDEEVEQPHTYIFQPVYDSFYEDRKIAGLLTPLLRWDNFFLNLLPDSQTEGITMILRASCNLTFTYIIQGPRAQYVGSGDFHDPDYDDMEQVFEFASFASLVDSETASYCQYSVSVYPTKEWSEQFFTSDPYIYAAGVVSCFLITCLFFGFYDILVQRRQKKVLDSATKTDAIVSSLFPSNVRDRLIDELGEQEQQQRRQIQQKKQIEAFKAENIENKDGDDQLMIPKNTAVATSETIFGSKPIADLFPNTTVMFADMVGFTAWASVRDPTQVFTLLETIYHSFDQVGKRMKHVYKVETIGDCYVAVSGLPQPRDNDHAIIMAKFAVSCLHKMHQTVKDLELTLGPGTAELDLRVGLHSGPVTAGVLRGDKGRFQLFGDTMNTASRIETTGHRGRIQVSEETATLLVQQGGEEKQKWLVPRENKVNAKGKGELQTFWINISPGSIRSKKSKMSLKSGTSSHYYKRHLGGIDDATVGSGNAVIREEDDLEYGVESSCPENRANKSNDDEGSVVSASISSTVQDDTSSSEDFMIQPDKQQRLIDWNVEMLARMLQQIVARRTGSNNNVNNSMKGGKGIVGFESKSLLFNTDKSSACVLDEVKNTITLPKLDLQFIKIQTDPSSIKLSFEVMQQLTEYVTAISDLYMKHPFHNFEHASHVSMSVSKLLNRIVNPNEVSTKESTDEKIATERHEHTFGLSSDPLTHFACVFSALIHDLDHPGVPNMTLVKEQAPLAKKYNDQSVAEQHSVVTAWEMLMSPKYTALRDCIYCNKEEFQRFRQLVVNIVMATDIMDKDLGALRKSRWDTAFSDESSNDTVNAQVRLNCKATIVLEHLIQASDVAHTMQHWHVYRKWNERLFREMYKAFKAGRMEKDPSEFWYAGEIGFFDHYIIPLAKKLDTCGVFGVSSDEYLTYALQNRREWEEKGQSLVKEYMSRCQQHKHDK